MSRDGKRGKRTVNRNKQIRSVERREGGNSIGKKAKREEENKERKKNTRSGCSMTLNSRAKNCRKKTRADTRNRERLNEQKERSDSLKR